MDIRWLSWGIFATFFRSSGWPTKVRVSKKRSFI